ncbi:hypothetical protein SAMN05428975_1169 [Mucilaginibacter sp. OK268]|uniref:hypothetical protein n=1 Tax=Mucilaginibacter sp. OK268 TaxID=1881048 RepID=UPI000884C532|nr:hypothetical protein [Mucilaginibacter sp. OK268]SDP32820.1 hypothetical protein SAMN05428975_1169 [Mucilaginibacter sp. OK268]
MSPLKCAGVDTGNHSRKDQVQARKQYIISCSENINDEKEQPVEGPEVTPSGSVCAFCQQDFGDVTLNKLSVYPICDNCKLNLDKSIFPSWVKLFFAGVLVLVVFSIFWNWRFYSAYRNIKHANEAFGKQSFSGAANFMSEASAQVPEISDLAEMAAYFKAVDLLSKDKSAAALVQLEKCKDLSPNFHVKEYILQAQIGSGFDNKDYKLFLAASKSFLQLDTTQSQSWAGVSSAYACLYAQNNVDSLKQLSLKYFNKAKTLDDTSVVAKEYYGLIQYRLDSRQIITRDQFHKKFPNGYTSSNR